MSLFESLTALTAFLSAIAGGIMFIFSNTVVAALDKTGHAAATKAMVSINRVIVNPLFLLVFMGPGPLSLILLIMSARMTPSMVTSLAIGGALMYIAGPVAVTMARNVPLNNELERVATSGETTQTPWQHYYRIWTRWNSIRTVGALGSGLLLLLSVLLA